MKRIGVTRITFVIFVIIIGIFAIGSVVAAPNSSPMREIPTGDLLPGESNLNRSNNGVSFRIHAEGLEAGGVYTVWYVFFNSPENCNSAGPDGAVCGPADSGNPDVDFSVAYGAGHVVGPSGSATFAGSTTVGSPQGQILVGNGLTNPQGAEIHMVVRNHRQPIQGLVHEMLNSFGGGCNEATGGGPGAEGNDCVDEQFSVQVP